MKRDIFFQAFCQTLQADSREMHKWLQMDLEENMLIHKHGIQEVGIY